MKLLHRQAVQTLIYSVCDSCWPYGLFQSLTSGVAYRRATSKTNATLRHHTLYSVKFKADQVIRHKIVSIVMKLIRVTNDLYDRLEFC